MTAAEYPAAALQAVAYDAHPAMRTRWCNCMDRALETVKRVALATGHELEGFVVLITASVAFRHNNSYGDTAQRLCVAGSKPVPGLFIQNDAVHQLRQHRRTETQKSRSSLLRLDLQPLVSAFFGVSQLN